MQEDLPAELTPFDVGDVRLVVGGGGFLPALHKSVAQIKEVGVPQSFEVLDAFGESNPNLGPATVPKASAPEGLEVGMQVRLSSGMVAKVTAVTDEDVTIDANHPMAGKPLAISATLTSEPVPAESALKPATFAGGCFWGLELAFQREVGVITTEVGYTQGSKETPTYEEVCSGTTGHTEAVRLRYDPEVVSYDRLCELFWERLGDNRFLLNQVGNDRGTQYRHGIYTHDAAQATAAAASLEAVNADGKTVHTELEPAEKWWPAEEYHMQYLQKGGQSARKEAAETIRCYG